MRSEPATRFLLLALTVSLAGCYEQEIKLRNWAKEKAPAEFRQIVRIDIRARLEKALSTTLDSYSRDITSQLNVSAELFEELSMLPPASERYFRFWADRVSRDLPRVDNWVARLRNQERSLKKALELCRPERLPNIPPPADLAALSSIFGGESFSIYIGFTTSGGDFKLSDGSYHNSIEGVANWMNEKLESLFASDEEKKAEREARQFLNAAAAGVDERKLMLTEECQVLAQQFRPKLDAVLDFFMSTRFALEIYLQLLISEPGKALQRLDDELLLAREETERKAIQRQIDADRKYRVANRVVAYLDQIRQGLVRVALASDDRRCSDLENEQRILDATVKELHELDSPYLKARQDYLSQMVGDIRNGHPLCFLPGGPA